MTDDSRTLIQMLGFYSHHLRLYSLFDDQCQGLGHRLLARILIPVFRKCGFLGADLSEDPGMVVPTEPREDVICLLSRVSKVT